MAHPLGIGLSQEAQKLELVKLFANESSEAMSLSCKGPPNETMQPTPYSRG